jgi:hypothetical protein
MRGANVQLIAVRPMHTSPLQGDWVRAVWLSPFPYQMFGTIVGFIVVFRCERLALAVRTSCVPKWRPGTLGVFHCRAQWAHERYIAGRDGSQTMTARWADACAQVGRLSEACCHWQARTA